MELEKCPENLEDRRVVAIQKQKDSHKLNDLRPLSISSVFSKIIEKSH